MRRFNSAGVQAEGNALEGVRLGLAAAEGPEQVVGEERGFAFDEGRGEVSAGIGGTAGVAASASKPIADQRQARK